MASLFTTQTPTVTDASDGGAAGISTATTVRFTATGTVTGIRFYSTVTVGGTYTAELWRVTAADTSPAGTLLATKVGGTPSSGGWNAITFDTPVSVATGTLYRAVINNSQGRYVALTNLFASFVSNGSIIGDSDADNPVGLGTLRQGTFKDNSAAGAYPSIGGNKTGYLVDVEFTAGSTASAALTATATVAATAAATRPAAAILTATADIAAAAVVARTAAASLTAVATITATASTFTPDAPDMDLIVGRPRTGWTVGTPRSSWTVGGPRA